ncbi:MAG: hypothetical protein DRN27_10165 [Thermoplasmata archaeon]|nr:MAG: hypothetical protein DRN27_10165 [Thermoplasmata archaeon]
MEKFLIKNKKNIDKLNIYIDKNKDDIRMMILSPDLFLYFKENYDCTDYREKTEFSEEQMKYRGLRIVRDVYSPAQRLYFLRKSESIDFNIPCICGIYRDEIHP